MKKGKEGRAGTLLFEIIEILIVINKFQYDEHRQVLKLVKKIW